MRTTPAGLERILDRIDALTSGRDVGFAAVLASAAAPASSPVPQPAPAGEAAWRPAIEGAAVSAGIDPRLLTAVVWTESGFRPDAVSQAGAVGLTQLMPATAAGLGVDPTVPEANLAGGARYLSALIGRFGRLDLALAAYNAGPTRVAREGNVAAGYVDTVLARYRSLGGTP